MKEQEVNIFWFRRDLRLEDNTAMFRALTAGISVIPIFIFDKNILDSLDDRKDHRVTFIHDVVHTINAGLEEIGSKLLTFYDTPVNVFQTLSSEYNIHAVYANKDYEPYANNRDELIHQFLGSKGIAFHLSKDHVIFEEKEVVKNDGLPYTVFTPYKRKWLEKLRPLDDFAGVQSESHMENFQKGLKGDVVSLEAMNFEKSEIIAPTLIIEEDIISQYDEKRDFPGVEKGTSRLGVHLRFGTVSIRKLARVGHHLNPTYLSELIWRDFYSQILANFPHVAVTCFKEKYEAVKWINNQNDFEKWKNGQTGYPMVDAGMRELNATGHMHNRVRMITAGFLTKHLLIDYRWGEKYFAEKLFDFDMASNNGGWQWAAGCGTDAAPYFRIFNPISQMTKFDKELKYIKKWVPEYGSFDYAVPMVNHKAARERCLAAYKVALQP